MPDGTIYGSGRLLLQDVFNLIDILNIPVPEAVAMEMCIRDRQYRKAIAAGACLMIEINLCDNLVEKISGDWSFLIDEATRTPYDQFQRNVARQQIHPDDRRAFLQTFSREALKTAYNQERREIPLQYRRLSQKRQMVWVCLLYTSRCV